MGDRLGADVARRAVADAINRIEGAQRLRPRPQAVAAETEPRRAVVLNLGDEMGIARSAVEQIAGREPVDFVEVEFAMKPGCWQCGPRLLNRLAPGAAGQRGSV